MYIYAAIKNANGKREQAVYTNWDAFHADIFSPETEVYFVTNFKAHNKEEARQIAMDVYYNIMDTVNNDGNEFSYGEYMAVSDELERIGRRFGLLREFRENGII